MATSIPDADLKAFTAHLAQSKRIVALLGAGLSASSGLPTFRGAGGLWRSYDAVSLATPQAFARDPGLVWQFYSYRRHMALNAKPNRAHLALAELTRRKGVDGESGGFLTLSQNVDGLSPRAGHPAEGLKLLHGSLYDVKCWDQHGCGYVRRNDFTDPIVPALAIPKEDGGAKKVEESIGEQANARAKEQWEAMTATKHALINGMNIADVNVAIPQIETKDLPHCPKCQANLLRPGVVWFGESLPVDVMDEVDAWIGQPEKIDLMLVIGTSSAVWPAAGYTEIARSKGARIAIINMDENDARNLSKQDWFFQGDAAVIVPEILKSVVGDIGDFQEQERTS